MTREANAPPHVFFAAPGTPYSQPPLSKSTEGARDARVLTDPRTSTPRSIEACRSPYCRKSAVSMASRARCLRFSPLRPRWTSRFRRPLALGRLSTAAGPDGAKRTFDRLPAPAINGAQRRTVGAPGRSGLDRRQGKLRRISDAPNRPPLPAPRQKTLDQTPPRSRGRDLGI